MNKQWEYIRKIFREELGMPEYIADYIAVYDILVMTLTGLPISTISKDLLLSDEYVKDVLNEFFDFDGWKEMQDQNYWFIFNQTDNKESFTNFVKISGKCDIIDVDKIYKMCKELKRIGDELNEWYI